MNRIEQVKKILYQGYLTDIAAEKINALYSEPQVCPKPEQMMICPKGEECKHCNDNPIYGHNKPHLHRTECDHISPKCPACIPVPSTPASVPLPPELLTELREQIAETICKKFVVPQALKQKFSDMPSGARQYYLDIADSVLLKCHQSESAIRADQNKKIATWIQKNDNHFIFHFIPECGGDFCFLATEGMENECAEPDEGAGYCQYRDKCRYANKQLLFGQNFIAKLQKGDF